MTAADATTRLRQALWDVYLALGFDGDGERTPDAPVHPDLEILVVEAAKQFSAQYREALAEWDAEVTALREELARARGRVHTRWSELRRERATTEEAGVTEQEIPTEGRARIYRARTVELIEAIRYLPHANCQLVAEFTGDAAEVGVPGCDTHDEADSWVLEDGEAAPGDWIARGEDGRLVALDPAEFERRYRPVEDGGWDLARGVRQLAELAGRIAGRRGEADPAGGCDPTGEDASPGPPLCDCGDQLAAETGARCGNCQAAEDAAGEGRARRSLQGLTRAALAREITDALGQSGRSLVLGDDVDRAADAVQALIWEGGARLRREPTPRTLERYRVIKMEAHRLNQLLPAAGNWSGLELREVMVALEAARRLAQQFALLDEVGAWEDVHWRDLRNAEVPEDVRAVWEQLVPPEARAPQSAGRTDARTPGT